MNIYAADEAWKWLLQYGSHFSIGSDGASFEVTTLNKDEAVGLMNYLTEEKRHVVEITEGLDWRVF